MNVSFDKEVYSFGDEQHTSYFKLARCYVVVGNGGVVRQDKAYLHNRVAPV